MPRGLSQTNVSHQWLNWIRGVATTAPAAEWVKLHTGDPGSAGANNAAAGDTTRKQATHSAASGSAIALSANVGPWTNGGTSETLTDVSIWDASSAGNFLWSVQLSASQAWVNTNTFTLTTLGVSITPIAS